MNARIPRLSAALTLLAAGTALAAPGAPPAATAAARASTWDARASAAYRFLAHAMSDIPVDETGTPYGLQRWAEQRLRIMGEVAYRRPLLRVELGVDVLSGMLAGDTSTVGARFLRRPLDEHDAIPGFEPRRAMVAVRLPFGELRLGHMTSTWGYGVLANSGENELDFGDQRLGDLVERVAFATKPLKKALAGPLQDLVLALAFDLVYRDANANLLDEDVGLNAIASVFYRAEGVFAGIYAAFRNQWDRNDDRLKVLALDAYARMSGRFAGGRVAWDAGFEGVLLVGDTTRLRAEPDLEGASVLAGMAVARGTLEHRPSRVALTFEVGFASGDNDRTDDVARAATMNPDYRVGLILFNQLLTGLSARAADRLADPARVAVPPSGTSSVPTNGGVQNAFYLWPRVRFEVVRDLFLRAGVLYARAVADVADPYWSNIQSGGSNRNFYGGAATARDYGIEIQAGARYALRLPLGFTVHLGVDWAHLFPGGAFADAKGKTIGDIDSVTGRAVLDWRYE